MKKRSRTWLWICVGYLLAFALFCWACHAAGKMLVNEKEAEKPSHVERCLEEEAAAQAASRARAKRLASEGCSWSYTYILKNGDATVARGTQGASVGFRGRLTLDVSTAAPGYLVNPNLSEVACSGGRASVYYVRQYPASPAPTDPDQLAAYNAWMALRNPPAGMVNAIYFMTMWCLEVRCPSGTTPPYNTLATYVCAGWQAYSAPSGMPPYTWEWLGPLEIDEEYAVSITNVHRTATITQTLPSGQSGLRHPCQRTGSASYYADANSGTAAALASLSVTGAYPGDVGVPITIGANIHLAYLRAAAVDTGYAWLTLDADISNGLDVCELDLTPLTFYKDGGSSSWHWHGVSGDPSYTTPPDLSTVQWRTVPTGNSLTIFRDAAASSGAVDFNILGQPRCIRVTPRLWKQNKDAE